MDKILRLFILASALAASVAHAKDAKPYVLVGQIPVACPAEVKLVESYVRNPKLKLSPEQAVTIAEAKNQVRCNSKILQEVYADSENYYITKFGTPDSAIHTVVVNGRSGKVSVRTPK
jgi:hypothetical protein